MLKKTFVVVLLGLALALPAAAYTIYLKDGSRIIARDKYVIDGEKAIITLENGTQTFLAAAEIDVKRSDEANTSNLGGALIFEDGEFKERSGDEAPPPRRETVTDLIARGDATVHSSSRTPVDPAARTAPTTSGMESMKREPMRNIELATAVKLAFTDKGLEGAAIYQGTEQERPLVVLVAESEASVFHGLEIAADTLLALREDHPECEVLELLLTTSNHQRAGEFAITTEMAEQIKGKKVELAAFFVEHVRF